jgi:hypothetical protein
MWYILYMYICAFNFNVNINVVRKIGFHCLLFKDKIAVLSEAKTYILIFCSMEYQTTAHCYGDLINIFKS